MGRFLSGMFAFIVLAGLLLPASTAAESREERLVSFFGETPLEGSSLSGVRVVDSFSFAGVALVEGTPSAFARLSTLPGVAGVYEPEPLSWNLERSRGVVRADPEPGDAAWPLGGNVTIALVDSGIDAEHPAFEGRIAKSVRVARGGVVSSSGDDDGHGTHIAGILAGDGAGSREGRLHGLAPAARLVAVDISDSFTTTTALRAFEWVHDNRDAYNIRVVSNSWGREKADAHYDSEDPVIRASDALVADGLVVVFSAGNRGRDGEATLTSEAMNPNVLTVGSASASGRVEPYSSRGPARDAEGKTLSWVKPDLVAPGTGIVSTRTGVHAAPGSEGEDRYYTLMNGTSMAAPHVAAAAALLIDMDPELSPAMVAAILVGTAHDVDARGADPRTGHGMLDVRAALDAARARDAAARTVPVERVVTLHAEGSVTAVGGRVVLADGAPGLPPGESVLLPFSFPEGAQRVSLKLSWSGTGKLEADIVAPDRTRYPFTASGQSARLDMDVGPGAWRVEVRAADAAASTSFELEGGLTLVELRLLDAPAEFTARPYSGAAGYFETRGGAGRLLEMGASPMVLSLVGSGLALVGVAAYVRLKKR